MPAFEANKPDVSFFVGSFLTQVCFGVSDLGLNFDRHPVYLMIQSSFGTRAPQGNVTRHELKDVLGLRSFLNMDVTAAEWAAGGTLVLRFADESEIHVFDDSDQYESYTINRGQLTIPV